MKREVGRPREFADEDVFPATTQAIKLYGYRGLSMRKIALLMNRSAPALTNRFGSLIGLLDAYLDWSADLSQTRFEQVRNEYPSPLEALRARFRIPAQERPDEVAEDSSNAPYLIFFLEGRLDPNLEPIIDRHRRRFEEGIVDLLERAREAGEITVSDAQALAHSILSALSGAEMMWSPRQEVSLFEVQEQVLDTVLDRYRVSSPHTESAPRSN